MAITNRYAELPETEIHDLLRNERRRQVIKHLQDTVGATTLREVAEAIAEHETGESPPPKGIRNSVYNSLHQTHLPKLDRRGIVEYDSGRKTIRLTEDARTVDVYMEVVTPYGITWSEYYSMLGLLSLFVIFATLVGVPVVSMVEPLLWVSLFLLAFAASLGYQLWCDRWVVLNALFD
ncbi:hypothetical protein C471_01122 [Halorubrum saccharovorum DSM 1137]|uniref:DUF7344 domain-containing protein n=1 Tax=Halorubrum saccharovorum DSM 1137 TaxID=1227484 RepID=M0E885_9EURY|nr:hypothetical protein [Halorubrum saccharovorum]ELZ43238.1 hypothetical protein C471_01122 [Halorubrum saccharovorum DSM 1137]